MTHPTDEDLIFHFYGEHPPADRARIDAHLGACVDCRRTWEEIGRTLQIADGADVPEPGPGFERIMWARVQAALPPPRSRWNWKVFVPVASAAALVIAFMGGVRFWSTRVEPQAGPTPAQTAAASLEEIQQTRERALFAALGDHLAQTEVLLTELMNTPVQAKTSFGDVRSTAGDLVASGRLYRTTAEQTGHRVIAAMLQDLEPVLVEVARSPEQVNSATVRSIRERIDDEGLLFKVRAVATDRDR